MNNDKLENEIAEALEHLNPASLNYSEWVSVGMALKNEGFPAETWESWSAKDPERYHPGECLKKWNTFERSGTGKGTIFLLCKQHSGHTVSGSRYKYSGEITEETIIDDPALIRWTEPGQDWNPLEDMQKYISVLFNPAEYVGYCVNSRQDQKTGKYIPKTGGNYDRTAERLLQELSSAERIEDVFLDYDKNAGAWIRFNPLDGNGAKDANITDYRFTLIESDNMPINEQIQKYIDLQLPIAALVHSGGKSAHAIVRINAKSKEEYNSRIDLLYSELKRNGFETDTQNRNPSRLSRAPGFMRNGKKQYLIAVNIGAPSWKAWADSLYRWKVPEERPLAEIINPPAKRKNLIDGYLKEKGKLIISGTPKTGKSFLIYQLAYAVATGRDWIGHHCRKGVVYYFDGELCIEDTYERWTNTREKMFISHPETLHYVNTYETGGDISIKDIAEDAKHGRYKNADLIILDSLYMFLKGDENSNYEMKDELKNINRIIKYTGAAVIAVHHMSKGIQSGKASMDRISGAGTFSRFFETILSLNLLSAEPYDEGRALRLEGDARNFNPAPVNLWFKDGIYTVDTSGDLAMRSFFDPKKETLEKKNGNDVSKVNHVYAWLKENGKLDDSGRFDLETFRNAYVQCYEKGIQPTTARDHLKKAGYITEKGITKHMTKTGTMKRYEVSLYKPDMIELQDPEEPADCGEDP